MATRELIKGFDYHKHDVAQLTRREWQERLRAVLASGGKRRVELGDTFAHDKSGKLLFEVYGNIPI